MAYDEDLADRIREVLSGEPVEEKKMFGGLAFLLGGHLGVSVSGRGGLLVHVPAEQTQELLARPGAEEFEMSGRAPMRGWVRVRPEVLDDEATLQFWVRRGIEAARRKPPRK